MTNFTCVCELQGCIYILIIRLSIDFPLIFISHFLSSFLHKMHDTKINACICELYIYLFSSPFSFFHTRAYTYKHPRRRILLFNRIVSFLLFYKISQKSHRPLFAAKTHYWNQVRTIVLSFFRSALAFAHSWKTLITSILTLYQCESTCS